LRQVACGINPQPKLRASNRANIPLMPIGRQNRRELVLISLRKRRRSRRGRIKRRHGTHQRVDLLVIDALAVRACDVINRAGGLIKPIFQINLRTRPNHANKQVCTRLLKP